MRRVVIVLWLVIFGSSALAADVVPWLYEVAVPVEDQSATERNRAAGDALLKLLTRLSGLASVTTGVRGT